MSAKCSAHDVAAYVLQKQGAMTAMKLQKLVYYCQAWSLVWDERPMFREDVQAWANGPVVRELYVKHRGEFMVTEWEGDANCLDKRARETADAVLKYYGSKSSAWLSELTHKEQPWKSARLGVPDGERSEAVIPHASMAEYYGSL